MGGKKEEKEKPLEKMTAKDLRELGKTIPDIVGVHGMNKEELVAAIKKARGIAEVPDKGKKPSSVREIKAKIRVFKTKREKAVQENDRRMANIYRGRISRLKKKSRRAA